YAICTISRMDFASRGTRKPRRTQSVQVGFNLHRSERHEYRRTTGDGGIGQGRAIDAGNTRSPDDITDCRRRALGQPGYVPAYEGTLAKRTTLLADDHHERDNSASLKAIQPRAPRREQFLLFLYSFPRRISSLCHSHRWFVPLLRISFLVGRAWEENDKIGRRRDSGREINFHGNFSPRGMSWAAAAWTARSAAASYPGTERNGGRRPRPRSNTIDTENPSDPAIIWHCTLQSEPGASSCGFSRSRRG
ncbi:hypothetical protein K0M31_012100, partial [Melipona bicolor]